ncbi:MG2 domain-containing protein [Lentisphaerota bacterium WC36G]|nr:hypothetical protein LJT99_05490 [Lentisphaerae bacterium WC36]
MLFRPLKQRKYATLIIAVTIAITACFTTHAIKIMPSNSSIQRNAHDSLENYSLDLNKQFARDKNLKKYFNKVNRSDINVNKKIKNYQELLKYLHRKNKIFLFDTINNTILTNHNNENFLELKIEIANSYLNTSSNGHIIDGVFLRGVWFRDKILRSKAKYVHNNDHDYKKALSILLPYYNNETEKNSAYITTLFNVYLATQHNFKNKVEIFVQKTPNKDLGNFKFYSIPNSFKAAKNDGERIQFLVSLATKNNFHEVLLNYANALIVKFGLRNLKHHNSKINKKIATLAKNRLFAKLKDNEILKVYGIEGKTHIKKISLPNNYNYIAILKDLLINKETNKLNKSLTARTAFILGETLQYRQRYDKAAKYYSLGKDKETTNCAKQILAENGSFTNTKTFVTGQKLTVNLTTRNAEKVAIKIFDFSNSSWLDSYVIQKKVRSKELFKKAKQITSFTKKITLSTEDKLYHNDKKLTLSMGDYIDNQRAGKYLIEASFDGKNKVYIPIVINELAVTVLNSSSSSNIVITAINPLNKQIVKEFSGYIINYKNGKKTHFSTTSGILNLDYNINERTSVKVVSKDKKIAFINSIYLYNQSNSHLNYSYIITDRSVYRPNDTVFFKIISFKEQTNGNSKKLIFAKGQRYFISIKNPQNEDIKEIAYFADEYGSYSGSFVIPKDAKLGCYSINNRLKHKTNSLEFFVEEYRAPEYEVMIEQPNSLITPETDFSFTIKGKLYSGQPLANAKVAYTITPKLYQQDWYPIGPWGWLYGYDFICRNSIELSQNNKYYPRPHKLGKAIRGIGTLDNNGKLIVNVPYSNFDIIKDFEEKNEYPLNIIYDINVTMKDSSQREVSTSSQIKSFVKPFDAKSWTDKNIYFTGEVIKISTQVKDLATNNNNNLNFSGEMLVSKLNKDNKFERQTVLSVKLTKSNRLEKEFKVNSAGLYRFEFKLKNDNSSLFKKIDENTSSIVYVMVIGKNKNNANKTSITEFNRLNLFTEKKTYQVGDTAKIIITTDNKNIKKVLLVNNANLINNAYVTMNNGVGIYEMNITSFCQPQTNLTAIAYTPEDGFNHKEIKLYVPPVDKLLDVKIGLKQNSIKPGAENEINVQLTDKFGKKVTGELVIAVYDESIDAIAKQNQSAIYDYFYGRINYNYLSRYDNVSDYYYDFFNEDGAPFQEIDRWENTILHANGQLVYRKKEMRGVASQDYDEFFDMEASSTAPKIMMQSKSLGVSQNAKFDLNNIKVRSFFADTALWKNKVVTDKNGVAKVTFNTPENLSRWKVKVWAINKEVQVGYNETTFVTAKDFQVRGIIPRFLVEGDEADLSLIIQNFNKEKSGSVVSEINIEGDALKLTKHSQKRQNSVLKANSTVTEDWRIKAVKSGTVKITFKAATDFDSDGLVLSLPITVYGTDKMVAFSGTLSNNKKSQTIDLEIPKKIKNNTQSLTINVSPTVAGAIIEALPYLAEYPYGCTEQTLNRFLPTVTVYQTMKSLGIDLTQLASKRENNNLNSQELGDSTKRRKQWEKQSKNDTFGQYNPNNNPIYDADEIKVLTKKGVERLLNFQNNNGAWGWFNINHKGGEPSLYLTALIYDGLMKARMCEVDIPEEKLEQAANWLFNTLKNNFTKRVVKNIADSKKFPNDKFENFVSLREIYTMYVLINNDVLQSKNNAEDKKFITNFINTAITDKNIERLNSYGKILLALTLKIYEKFDCAYALRCSQLCELIDENLVIDNENQTAYLEDDTFNVYWYWQNSEIEAMSYYIKLLLATSSDNNNNIKIASKMVKYLVNNRKNSTFWNSTRDTAIAIDAICEYLNYTDELNSNKTVKVFFNNKLIETFKFTKENLFTTNTKIVLNAKELKKGSKPQIRIELENSDSNADVFFNAYLSYFSQEAYISKSGLELKVQRMFYRVDNKKDKEEFTLLKNDSMVQQGDEIMVIINATAKNDYEYLLFEDFKVAGFEPVEKNSGYQNIGLNFYVNSFVEFRFDRVCFFVERMPRGKSIQLSYRLKAETTGKFTALPLKAEAMYAPELKANSNQFNVKIISEK